MENKDQPVPENGFGAYLKEGRAKTGFSLDEVAKKLFIHVKTLQNLEAEKHSELLEQVFVEGFIRSYADFIGLRVEKALLLYRESYRRWWEIEEGARRRALRKKYVRAWIGGGLATFILILLFTFSGLGLIQFFLLDKKSSVVEEPLAEQSFSEGKSSVQNKLHLEVYFPEPGWLKIMVDGNYPQSFTVESGQRLEFEADKTYNIMIGNATGVRLYLNGKHVSVSGSGGQPVALFLP